MQNIKPHGMPLIPASPEVLHNGPKGLAHSGSNQKKKKTGLSKTLKLFSSANDANNDYDNLATGWYRFKGGLNHINEQCARKLNSNNKL